MQEAYRPPCSEYSFCCPTWVPLPPAGYPPPILTWPGGVPDQGTPPARVPPGQGTPRQGTPRPGYPPGRVPPWLDLAGYPPWQGTPLAWPGWTWPGYPPGQGTPPAGYPPARVPPGRVSPRPGYPPAGYPPSWTWQGTPLAGYPPGWTWPGYPPGPGYPPPGWTWQGTPPAAPWHSGKCCKALWDMGTPPCEQTNKVKLLPSRRTTYAGGNNKLDVNVTALLKCDQWEHSLKRVSRKDMSVGATGICPFQIYLVVSKHHKMLTLLVVIVRSHLVCIRSH